MIPCMYCAYMFNCPIEIMEIMDKRQEKHCESFMMAPDERKYRLRRKDLMRMIGNE